MFENDPDMEEVSSAGGGSNPAWDLCMVIKQPLILTINSLYNYYIQRYKYLFCPRAGILAQKHFLNNTILQMKHFFIELFPGRIFLKASPTLDRGFFAVGMIIFIVSLAVVFWIEKHASLIFGIKVQPIANFGK